MIYQKTLDFLFNALPVWEKMAGSAAYKPGTERVEEFHRFVGSPANELRTIHVAGTNGKGSTASMLAAVLQSTGLRVGLYTSPHLVDFRERIRVDGQMIGEAAVVEFAEQFRDEMVRLGMTFFEMATVMALWYFERSGIDIAVIETGLGGRHDATNIITPILSIITNIGLEHTQYLGDTVAKIAVEKSGIIKPGVPVVVGESDPESDPVFRTTALEMGSSIIFADKVLRNDADYELDLRGEYQQKNVRTVLAAVDVLQRRGVAIPDEAVCMGLTNTTRLTGLRARWEVLGTKPLIVADTAHNTHGFSEIAHQLASWRKENMNGNIWMVLGFASDKNVGEIVGLLPPDAHYILTQANSPRAMSIDKLMQIFPGAETVVPVQKAIASALEKATPDDLVYIGGSNFVVGEFLKFCS